MADKTTAKKAPVKKTEKITTKDLSLEEQLQTKKADLLELRKTLAAGELVNPQVISRTRKEIARLLTKINASKKESK